jgi:hypothetical protein
MPKATGAKTNFLQIRLTPEDRRRIENAAASEHLDPSTWARRAILLALDGAEKKGQKSTGRPS